MHKILSTTLRSSLLTHFALYLDHATAQTRLIRPLPQACYRANQPHRTLPLTILPRKFTRARYWRPLPQPFYRANQPDNDLWRHHPTALVNIRGEGVLRPLALPQLLPAAPANPNSPWTTCIAFCHEFGATYLPHLQISLPTLILLHFRYEHDLQKINRFWYIWSDFRIHPSVQLLKYWQKHIHSCDLKHFQRAPLYRTFLFVFAHKFIDFMKIWTISQK